MKEWFVVFDANLDTIIMKIVAIDVHQWGDRAIVADNIRVELPWGCRITKIKEAD